MSADRHPLDIARDQILPYGFAILPDGTLVTPRGRATGVKVVAMPFGRYQARRNANNDLLWSGVWIPKFLEGYWFARKLAPNEAPAAAEERTDELP